MTKIGQRYTKPRRLIFAVLEHLLKPVTVQEILSLLKKSKKQIDPASVYRNLELMKTANLVKEIVFGDGKKRYELSHDSERHHHHLVCNNCGTVENIRLEEQLILSQVTRQSDFAIDNHQLEFFGLCSDCQ